MMAFLSFGVTPGVKDLKKLLEINNADLSKALEKQTKEQDFYMEKISSYIRHQADIKSLILQ